MRSECGVGDPAPAPWVEGFRGSGCPGASGELLVFVGRVSLCSCWLSRCNWLCCASAWRLSCISSFRGQAVSSWSHTSFCLCVFSDSLGIISIQWGRQTLPWAETRGVGCQPLEPGAAVTTCPGSRAECVLRGRDMGNLKTTGALASTRSKSSWSCSPESCRPSDLQLWGDACLSPSAFVSRPSGRAQTPSCPVPAWPSVSQAV